MYHPENNNYTKPEAAIPKSIKKKENHLFGPIKRLAMETI